MDIGAERFNKQNCTTTLHVHHTFLAVPFCRLFATTTTTGFAAKASGGVAKCRLFCQTTISRAIENVDKRQLIVFLFPNLNIVLRNLTPGEVANI